MAAPDLKVYMREHSTLIRKKSGHNKKEYIDEDPVVSNVKGLARSVLVILCRNKQRLMQQAWHRFCKGAGVVHDYTYDVRRILSRNLHPDEQRSELEIEVLWKWMVQNADLDPTGIATGMLRCKTKTAVVAALQHIRLEKYHPGDAVIYQGGIPCEEDGVFTVFSGSCDVIVLPAHSVQLLRLQVALKEKKWDQANHTLAQAPVVGVLKTQSGFGELATLTNMKRSASIRASLDGGAEVLVLPKQPLLNCLEQSSSEGAHGKSGEGGSKLNEGVDYLRQTGLANRMSSQDLVAAANSMTKRVLNHSEILFCKGEPVESIFLVLSGDFVLDTGDSVEQDDFRPFQNVNLDKCYYVSSNSILGDEGVVGLKSVFESTAVAISEVATVFEVFGAGCKVLEERIKSIRYTGLAYRHLPRLGPMMQFAEEINLYSFFNSLRKCIASSKPYRGVQLNGTGDEAGVDDQDASVDDVARAVALLTGGLASPNMTTKGRPKSPTNGKGGMSFGVTPSMDKYEMQTRFLLPPSVKGKRAAYQAGASTGFNPGAKPTRVSVIDRSMAKNPMSLRMAMKAQLTDVEGNSKVTGEEVEPGDGMGIDLKGEVHNGIRYLRDPRTKTMRRMIFGVAMHHAEDAIKHRKKLEGLKLKQHAQESIILDQTLKSSLTISNVEKSGMQNVQKKLHRAFADFRQRLFDEEVKTGTNEVTMANTSTAVQLFSSFAQSLGIEEGEDEEWGGGQSHVAGATETQEQGLNLNGTGPNEGQSRSSDHQDKGDEHSVVRGLSQLFDEAKLIKLGLDQAKKIDQYFAWLESSSKRKELHSVAATEPANTVPSLNLSGLSLSEGEVDNKNVINNRESLLKKDPSSTMKRRGTNVRSAPHSKLTQGNLQVSQQQQQRKPSTVTSGMKGNNQIPPAQLDATSRESPSVLETVGMGLPGRVAASGKFTRMDTPNTRRVISWNVEDMMKEEVISEDSDIPHPSFYKLRQLESPRGFFEALEHVNFAVRREHRLGNLWNTRYMKVSYQISSNEPTTFGIKHVKKSASNRVQHRGDIHVSGEDNEIAVDVMNEGRTEGNSGDQEDLFNPSLYQAQSEDSQEGDTGEDALNIIENSTDNPSLGPIPRHQDRRFSESNSEHSFSASGDILDVLHAASSDSMAQTTPKPEPHHLSLLSGTGTSLAKSTKMSAAEIARMNLDYPSGSLSSLNPSSDAIEKYHEILCTDRLSRHFLDGKKKSNSNSKHQLRTTLSTFQEMEKSEQLAQRLEGKAASLSFNNNRKILEQSTKQLFVCLDPNPLALSTASLNSSMLSRVNADDVEKEKEKEKAPVKGKVRKDNLDRLVTFMQSRSTAEGEHSQSLSSTLVMHPPQGKQSGSALKEYIRPTIKSLDQEANKQLDKKHDEVLFHALQVSHDNMLKKSASVMDEELLDWQKFSVAQSVKMKTGPKMTLPVLVQSSSAPGNSIKFSRGKRAKRYGSGGMIPIGGDADFKLLEGPPSYLEVFKKPTAKVQLH